MEGCIHDTVVFSHRLKNQAQNLAKEAGMDWLAGPQGRVVTYLFHPDRGRPSQASPGQPFLDHHPRPIAGRTQ